MVWGRFDCKRLADFPEVQVEFEQANMICSGKAQAAAISGTASMPTGYGLSGAIVSGISQGITGAQISQATGKSCMAERGLYLAKRSEVDAKCPRKELLVAEVKPAATKPLAKPKPAAKPVAVVAPVQETTGQPPAQ